MASKVPSASSSPLYDPGKRLENQECMLGEIILCAFGGALFMDTATTTRKVQCVFFTTAFGAAGGAYIGSQFANPATVATGAAIGATVGFTCSITKVAIDEYKRNKARKCQLQPAE